MYFLQSKITVSSLVLFLLIFSAQTSGATAITIDPVADGSIYTCDSCNPVANDAYVLAAGYIQGVVEFSLAQVNQPIESAIFSLNPYALPLFGETMELYGYASTDGVLTAADGFAGVFLGLWDLPVLGYGQDTYFDVSNFLSTINSPYVGFNIRSYSGTNLFSSLEYNYGHPSQLTVAFAPEPVPEPSTFILLSAGIISLIAFRRRTHKKLMVNPGVGPSHMSDL